MFEREAEEYYETETPMIENITGLDFQNEVSKAFQKGAEFGYNKAMNEQGYRMEFAYSEGLAFGKDKANEWHYPSKGEYPKECACCLLYLGDNVNPITGWRHRGVWYFEDDRDLEEWQDDVIAWKEIVLPKEGR